MTVTFGDVLQNVLAGLRVGSIYAIVGLGFGIIYNATGIINFAQGEFLMVGAMTAWWAHSAEVGLGLPVGPAFLLGVLAAAVVGGLFERFAIHPRRRASVITLIIITVAGSMVLRAGAMLLWGSDTQIISPFTGERRIEIVPHAESPGGTPTHPFAVHFWHGPEHEISQHNPASADDTSGSRSQSPSAQPSPLLPREP